MNQILSYVNEHFAHFQFKGGNQLPAAHGCARGGPCKSSKVTISKSSLFVHIKILNVWMVWLSEFQNVKNAFVKWKHFQQCHSGLFVVLPTPQLSWRPGPGKVSTTFPAPLDQWKNRSFLDNSIFYLNHYFPKVGPQVWLDVRQKSLCPLVSRIQDCFSSSFVSSFMWSELLYFTKSGIVWQLIVNSVSFQLL